jgi:hypothetical protein
MSLPSQSLVPVAYRPPFAFGAMPWMDVRPHGETILEMVRSVPGLPRQFQSRGIVCINGEEIPRHLWCYVRPKPTCIELPISVTLHWPLQGGGGGGGRSGSKSIIGIVAAIALIAVTAFILGPGGAALIAGAGLPASVLGISTATLIAGAVGIAGALAISALTAPPTQEAAQITSGGGGSDVNTDNRDPASAGGNVLNPGGAIPRVVGTRKVFPPFICEPVVELVDEDEYVEAVIALNGPHSLDDIRVDGVSITDAEDVEYEIKEGWPSDTAITLVERQGRTTTPQITLSVHTVDTNDTNLLHQSLPEQDLPIWHGVVSRSEPDEIWLHLLFPGGMVFPPTSTIRIPLRIRMRLRASGSSPPDPWINLPEVHVSGNTTQQIRLAVVFKWQETADALETVPTTKGFVYASIDVPPQVVAPATPTDREWDANAYFDDGAGNVYLFNGNEASTRVRNINLFVNRMEVYLQEATFPRGIYEIEIKRGSPLLSSEFAGTTYLYGGNLFDFFWYNTSGSTQIAPVTRTNYSDRAALVRVVSIWNEHPVQQTGFALIAIKAINRQISRISVQASGYVRDWSGSAWDTWTTTSNPAPHYVDVLSGAQNLDPLPEDLRDDTGLVAWRTLCSSNDWTCDAIIDDMRTQDALALLASCAYAKPYQSDQYGVTVDKDVSAESPIQVFSRVNASNVKFERGFARVPAGFIVGYRDESADDDRAQTIVYQRDPSIATSTGLLESITYDGLVETDKVEARALFDLDQVNQRATFYSLDTDVESIVCRRGSLVALQHDVLTSRAGDAHIKTKTLTGSDISGFVLDSVIPIINELDMHAVTDMHLIADMHLVGITTGIAIRRINGTISTHSLSDVTGESATITLTTPFADTAEILGYDDTSNEYGCLLVSGELDTEYRRLLVATITPGKDLRASLTLVDEAPELVRF